jgi:hypothetical protein
VAKRRLLVHDVVSSATPNAHRGGTAAPALMAIVALLAEGMARAATLAGWDTHALTGGTNNFGPSPLTATISERTRNNPRTESDRCHYGNRHPSESSISQADETGKLAVLGAQDEGHQRRRGPAFEVGRAQSAGAGSDTS